MSRNFAVTVAAVSVIATACVIEAPDGPVAPRPSLATLAISPEAATVEAGGSQQFTAVVTGSGTGAVPQVVSWSVRAAAPAFFATGSIDANGVYRVAQPPSSDARDVIIATSVVDPSLSREVVVDVPARHMSVAPRAPDLVLGESIAFSVTLRGLASKAVTWKCTYGTIDAKGVYTAPAAPLNGDDTVVAIAEADHDLAAGAVVTLHLSPPVLTSVSGTLQPFTLLTLFGSGFLAGAPNIERQLVLEFTDGSFGALPVTASDDRVDAFITGGPWTGRVHLAMWSIPTLTAHTPFQLVTSNDIVVPVR